MNWRYGPRGLGLVGLSGRGKTRAAYMLLKQMVSDGRKVGATNAANFSKLCVDQFADEREYRVAAEREIQSVYHADVWLLDDLGQQRTTERVESEIYALLEYRATRKLPTIWTSNLKGEALKATFSKKRVEAIMRRLIQSNDIATVWER